MGAFQHTLKCLSNLQDNFALIVNWLTDLIEVTCKLPIVYIPTLRLPFIISYEINKIKKQSIKTETTLKGYHFIVFPYAWNKKTNLSY